MCVLGGGWRSSVLLVQCKYQLERSLVDKWAAAHVRLGVQVAGVVPGSRHGSDLLLTATLSS